MFPAQPRRERLCGKNGTLFGEDVLNRSQLLDATVTRRCSCAALQEDTTDARHMSDKTDEREPEWRQRWMSTMDRRSRRVYYFICFVFVLRARMDEDRYAALCMRLEPTACSPAPFADAHTDTDAHRHDHSHNAHTHTHTHMHTCTHANTGYYRTPASSAASTGTNTYVKGGGGGGGGRC